VSTPRAESLHGPASVLFAGLLLTADAPLAAWALAPRHGRELVKEVLREGIPAVAQNDYAGLGDEAGSVLAWVSSREGVRLGQCGRDPCISVSRDAFVVSRAMGEALRHLNDYYGLTSPTLQRPVTHEELRAAVLTSDGLRGIRKVFEQAVRDGFVANGRLLVKETGGEATLDRGLRLHPIVDPTLPVLQKLARLLDDPQGVLSLFREKKAEMARIDAAQILKGHFDRLPYLRERGVAEGQLFSDFRRTLLTVIENCAATFTIEPAAQFDAVLREEWSGRYAGKWHIHGPHDHLDGWGSSEPPSLEDLEVAAREGQFLTLGFQPDGFDLYDASAIGDSGKPDLALLKIVRHRSSDWRRHFETLRRRGHE